MFHLLANKKEIEDVLTQFDKLSLKMFREFTDDIQFFIEFNNEEFKRGFWLFVSPHANSLYIINEPKQMVFEYESSSFLSYNSTSINSNLSEEKSEKFKKFNTEFEETAKELGDVLLNVVRKNCDKIDEFKLRCLFKQLDVEYIVSGGGIHLLTKL